MTTVLGEMSPSTVTFGIPPRLRLDGLLTVTATGIGSARGVGPGLTIRRGALLRSTMAAGRTSAARGAGARGRLLGIQSMAPRLSASSAVDLVSESAVPPRLGRTVLPVVRLQP